MKWNTLPPDAQILVPISIIKPGTIFFLSETSQLFPGHPNFWLRKIKSAHGYQYPGSPDFWPKKPQAYQTKLNNKPINKAAKPRNKRKKQNQAKTQAKPKNKLQSNNEPKKQITPQKKPKKTNEQTDKTTNK